MLGVAAIAALVSACAVVAPPPANPFAGAWTSRERSQIAFREDTVVVSPPGETPTTLGADSCAGRFRFGYSRKSREALIALAPHQPDLRRQLGGILGRPDYQVAELSCGEGGTIYVMLDERDLVAIHRDADIAGIERLSRL
jgi:hypothetical protein